MDNDNRPVKFQNAFQYYDQMYKPGISSVCKGGFEAKNTSLTSVDFYYQSLYSLYSYVACFLDKDNSLSMTKFYFFKIIQGKDLKKISNKYDVPLSFLKNIQEIKDNPNDKKMIELFEDIKKKIDLTRPYNKTQSLNQLKPRLKAIIEKLNYAKVELFYRMKTNKLFVPTADYDPGHAVREGFSKLH